jgi:hypothetical protein
MNPRDKSALVLDHAILRRLHIITVESSEEKLRAMLDGVLPIESLDQLAEWFRRHQAHLPFGHGMFAGARNPEELRAIWRGSAMYFLADVSGQIKEQYKGVDEEFPWH